MRKISKLIPMVCLAVSLFSAAASAQDTETEPISPGKDESGITTICYYGVTQKVTQKIAKRYMKLGATMGPCGESQPEEYSLGTFSSKEGCVPIIIWIPKLSMVEKPADSEKAIQLDLTNDEAAKGLLSLNTRQSAGR